MHTKTNKINHKIFLLRRKICYACQWNKISAKSKSDKNRRKFCTQNFYIMGDILHWQI